MNTTSMNTTIIDDDVWQVGEYGSPLGILALLVWEAFKHLSKKGTFRSKCMGKEMFQITLTEDGIKMDGKRVLNEEEVQDFVEMIGRHSRLKRRKKGNGVTLDTLETPPSGDNSV